jgi:hypothetical protein
MDGVAQYRKYADECRRLAATAKNLEHKKQLLDMATAWDSVTRQKQSELPKRTPTGLV